MNPKDTHFYHYTKKFEVLPLILDEGFWPQYSLEDFSWVQNGIPLFLAFPRVCFTVLPLHRSQMHREDYGDYVIGFDEDWKAAHRLRPLEYDVRAKLAPHHCRAMTKYANTCDGLISSPTPLKPRDFDVVWELLPYLKEKLGYTLQPLAKQIGDMSHEWVTKPLIDEREWRYIPENSRKNLFSVENYDAKTMKALKKLSEPMHDLHLRFRLAEVSIVIVVTDAERQQLVAKYPDLDGKIRLWDELQKPKADGRKLRLA